MRRGPFHVGVVEIDVPRRLRQMRGKLVAAVRRPDTLRRLFDDHGRYRRSVAESLTDNPAGHRRRRREPEQVHQRRRDIDVAGRHIADGMRQEVRARSNQRVVNIIRAR